MFFNFHVYIEFIFTKEKITHSLTLYLKVYIYLKNFGFKDGAIVPGQVELSGLSTLLRGSYPHLGVGHSQHVPCGLARG